MHLGHLHLLHLLHLRYAVRNLMGRCLRHLRLRLRHGESALDPVSLSSLWKYLMVKAKGAKREG